MAQSALSYIPAPRARDYADSAGTPRNTRGHADNSRRRTLRTPRQRRPRQSPQHEHRRNRARDRQYGDTRDHINMRGRTTQTPVAQTGGATTTHDDTAQQNAPMTPTEHRATTTTTTTATNTTARQERTDHNRECDHDMTRLCNIDVEYTANARGGVGLHHQRVRPYATMGCDRA